MVLQVMADDETPPRRYRRGNMALKGDAMLPGLKVGEGGGAEEGGLTMRLQRIPRRSF
jgi:hypothetical protein